MLGYHNSFNGSTIVEILRSPAEHTPNQIAYTFLLDGESTEAHLTYGELDQKARAIGSRLTTMGVSQQHALLIYPPGLDYITAFFGCLYANVVAVPIYPPRLNRSLLRLQTIMTDSQATIALTTSSILASIQPQHTKSTPLEHLHWLATDQPDIGHASEWSFRAIKPDSLAFLQYTSGSTAVPKGVMLSHANLLHNLELIRCFFKNTLESRGVIWLPPYHDVVQYLQYAEWQTELIKADDDEAQAGKAYWHKQQSRHQTTLRLPFEHEQTLNSSVAPDIISHTLERELVEQIKTYIATQKTSFSTVLLAVWNTLLWHMTGQPEVITEVLIHGRTHEELQSTFGLFDRYLPIRIGYQSSLSFNELVTQLTHTAQEAEEWQDFYSWLDSHELVAGKGHFPTIGFEFEEHPPRYTANDVTFDVVKLQTCLKLFKLRLACISTEDGLLIEFHYDKNTYDFESLQYLPERFEMLLKSSVNQPNNAIGKLDLLGPKEKQRLLGLQRISVQNPHQECLSHVFEQQVRRTPHARALIYETQQLTYAELNARANQLARRLQQQGVGPDVLVGISIDRSIDLIVAMLGVLKAGGAYVPIDPTLPQQRRQTLLEDIQSPVILTQQSFKEEFQSESFKVIILDSDWPAIAEESTEDLSLSITCEQLAYVLFTSGSTGRPKGICVEHRQLLNYLDSIIRQLDLPTGSNYALISTFAADLGNTVIFPSLCTSGCLHILSHQRGSSPDSLAEYFQQHAIDCLKIVPSHLKALLVSSRPEQVLPRRRLVLGGEGTPWDLVETVQRLAPDCRIINHYGPTETTVGVLTHWLSSSVSQHQTLTLPLSQVIDNTQVYVLDNSLQLTPIGVPGELCVGGAALARGYLHQPAQTSEKFIADPFSQIPGGRLYKTGNLARYLPDGSLEILARVDDQVKFHGYRVELGEIRQALNQHILIQDSVIILHKDQHQRETLAAYYLAKQELDSIELRKFLAQSILEETLPNTFIHLTHIPLTANGKIDRQALPSIEEARQKSTRSFVAPRTPTEIALAAIWSQVLGIEQIGIYDGFFT